MSETQHTAPAQRQAANSGCLSRLVGVCNSPFHPEHNGKACQCVTCQPVGYCVEDPCLDCTGPVDGCQPPDDANTKGQPRRDDNGGQPLAGRLGSVVFEAIDATNEENYWTLGMFATLEDAIEQLTKCTPDDLPSDRDCDDECCRVEVYEHKVGQWGGHGRKVYEHVWNGKWNSEQAARRFAR